MSSIMDFLQKALKLKKKKYVDIPHHELKEVLKNRQNLKIRGHENATQEEIEGFRKEVSAQKTKKPSSKGELLPLNVEGFAGLISAKGLERGSTILVSGGAGSGKTIFALQSLYNSLLANPREKAVYISTEEDVEKLKRHMLNNFGWDFYDLEKKGRIAFLQLDPIQIAREVEANILAKKKNLEVTLGSFEFQFTPDRIVLDSLSSLSIAFEGAEGYRKYLRYLIQRLEKYDSLNLMVSETEQDPRVYSRAGVEEFLVDGVIVLYNIKVNSVRQIAMEILKMRSCKHQKKLVPFQITKKGIEIYPEQELFGKQEEF